MNIPAAAIGTRLAPVTPEVGRDRPRLFAKATGDTDPVYVDVESAEVAGHPDLPDQPRSVRRSLERPRPDPHRPGRRPLRRGGRRIRPRHALHGLPGQTAQGPDLRDRIRTFRVRFAAITPVHGEPTRRARITAVQDGLATLEISVALSDGTTTLIGDATVAVD